MSNYNRNIEDESMVNAIELLKEEPRFVFEGTEKDYEDHIVLNADLICDALGLPKIKIIEQQRQIRFDRNQIIMDIVIRHIDGSITILEVKKSNDKNPWTSTNAQVQALGQMLLYRNVVKIATGVTPRVALITDKLFYRTQAVFIDTELPLALIEFQRDRLFMPYENW